MALTDINFTILSLKQHSRHYFVLLALNIIAAIASTLSIISIIRYGLYGVNWKSYLFLILGIICYFLADFIFRYYYVVSSEVLKGVSIIDSFWFIGYIFLFLHLFFIIKKFTKINKL